MKNDLYYALLPGSNPVAEGKELYEKAYLCWKEVWTQMRREIGVADHLCSDNFTRQDYVGALFYKDDCVALSFLRYCDYNRADFKDDSYFDNWSPAAQKELASRGNKILVCSQFTIHPKARGTTLGFSMKDVLTGIMIETFLNSDADGMTGALRVSKGVNKASENWGAHLIEKNVQAGGYATETADLVGYFKDKISNFDIKSDQYDLVKDLWKNHTLVERTTVSFNQVLPFKKAA